MSLAAELFKIGSELFSALLQAEQSKRYEVSEHFGNLARTFKMYPSAHRSKYKDQVTFLVGKTHGLIEALSGSGVFDTVLGKEKGAAFLTSMGKILSLKDVMAKGKYTEAEVAYAEILAIAGYFEGYSESLRAQAGKQ